MDTSLEKDLNMTTPVALEPSADQYLTETAQLSTLNNTLRVLLAVALVAICVLAFTLYTQSKLYANIKPVVIRVGEDGSAMAMPPGSLEYQLRVNELRYYLTHLVEDHYGRMRHKVSEAFQRKLYFLQRSTAQRLIEENEQKKIIQTFLTDGSPEIDIAVKNVSVEDVRTAPYKATVVFDKIYLGADKQEIRREPFTAHFVITMLDRIPNEFVPVNPLGIIITYFREDQGF